MHEQEDFILLCHNSIHVHSNLDEVHDLNSVNKEIGAINLLMIESSLKGTPKDDDCLRLASHNDWPIWGDIQVFPHSIYVGLAQQNGFGPAFFHRQDAEADKKGIA
jgi:hypothetical protein